MRASVFGAAVLTVLTCGASALAADAPADDGPRARWHPRYAAEIEAHGTFAAFDSFFVGLGGGVRVTVPIWSHAPFTRIDDDLGFGVGLDVVRYGAYEPNGNGRPPSLALVAYYLPLYLQWNVWMGARASVFVEPTLMWRFADYIDNCGTLPCAATTRFMPTGSLGLRFRIVDHAALTIRIGWPTASIGASWL